MLSHVHRQNIRENLIWNCELLLLTFTRLKMLFVTRTIWASVRMIPHFVQLFFYCSRHQFPLKKTHFRPKLIQWTLDFTSNLIAPRTNSQTHKLTADTPTRGLKRQADCACVRFYDN